MAFDVLTRWFFTDSGLSAGLAKANAELGRLGRAGPGAGSGLRAVEVGMRQLAFQAAGLTGPLGTAARGLLQLGGGSALVLGAAAGIGILSLAYRTFTKDSREAAKAQADFIAELEKGTARERAVAERSKLQGLQAQLASAERGQRFVTAGGLSTVVVDEARVARLRGEVAEQQREVNAATAAADEPAKRYLATLQRQHDVVGASVGQVARLEAKLHGLTAAQTEEAVRLAEATERRRLSNVEREKELKLIEDLLAAVAPHQFAPVDLSALGALPIGEDALRRAKIAERMGMSEGLKDQVGLPLLGQGTLDGAKPVFDKAVLDDLDRAREQVVGNFLAMGAAAVSGSAHMATVVTSAFANIIQTVLAQQAAAAGQELGLFGRLLGPIGLFVGSLFGGHRAHVVIDEYGPRAEDQMRRTRGEPQQVTVVLLGPNGQPIERTEYALARRSARDAVTRIPRDGLAA